MGRRGPPPKPTAIREREGDASKRPVNEREPKPKSGAPRCPAWLSRRAKTVWRRTVRELERMGVLTVADGDALAGYCQAFARWQEAEEFLQKHGSVFVVRGEDGRVRYMQQVPQVAIARTLLQHLRAFQGEFGLTPAARTRIEAEGYENEAELDAFLGAVFEGED